MCKGVLSDEVRVSKSWFDNNIDSDCVLPLSVCKGDYNIGDPILFNVYDDLTYTESSECLYVRGISPCQYFDIVYLQRV